jgi:hypothetical protein
MPKKITNGFKVSQEIDEEKATLGVAFLMPD